ncbi:MAG: tRNA (adenosine(37)-N6)-threonylcarbamoyltransferase complex ATPase subunit type 1 TsaE [Bacteroidales bacterium]|nr:tRNA (adenosine(37)-N6)-threonylcarbamoyltransferase complex ATPase subunit type 1 TsaE [Bacteroidales bacterium]
MTKYIANKLEDLPEIAKKIIEENLDQRIFLLEGEMGAGKTTLTKSICDYFEVKENVCSPTFAIVNEYLSPKVGKIFHFDFYRINKEEEAFDIGIEEYLYSGDYCFLEWSQKIKNLIPSHYVKVIINEINNKHREIKIERI